jgi:hypothetical protein
MFQAPRVIEPPTRTFEDANRIVTEAELLSQVAVKEKHEKLCVACCNSVCVSLSICCAF